MKNYLKIRYRIAKHLVLFFITGYGYHLLEVEHYWIMKTFKQ